MNQIVLFLITSMLCFSCSSDDVSTQKQQRAEYIYRKHNEFQFSLQEPKQTVPPTYSWKKSNHGNQTAVTKEYFRCKGSSLNPCHHVAQKEEILHQFDCGGVEKHSLPLRSGKEFIYPILIDLLNYIQTKTNKRVVITSGHRCPDHNTYVDPSPGNQYSKHTLGAAVSFYVQGLENNPQLIIDYIREYYKERSCYQGLKAYQDFQRYAKESDVTTQPWFNKEIFIKLYSKGEGRNFDNRHPYPYIDIQVRYDRDLNENVNYSWDNARRNYLRY